MDVYSCRVRPGGHLFHEVNKHGITAAEVEVLRHIHNGPEAVYNFTKTGEIKVKPRDEYERLAETYGVEPLQEVYGPPSSARLPEEIEDDYKTAEDEPAPKAKPAKKNGRKAKAKDEPEEDPADELGDETDDEDS